MELLIMVIFFLVPCFVVLAVWTGLSSRYEKPEGNKQDNPQSFISDEKKRGNSMYCKNCGNQIDDDAKFCTHCGTRVQRNAQDSVTQSPSSDSQSRESWEAQLKQRFGQPSSGEHKVHKQYALNSQSGSGSQNENAPTADYTIHNQQRNATQKEPGGTTSQEKNAAQKILSLIAKIPVAILIWFTLTITFSEISSLLLSSSENFLYIVLVLVVPVAAPFYLLSKKSEKKLFYQKGWVWAIGAVLAVMFASASGSIQEPDINPTDAFLSTTENSEAPVEVPQTTPPIEATSPETVPPTSDPAILEDEYKGSCQIVDYKELCRYSEKYAGANVRITVKIHQILDVGGLFSNGTAWRGLTDNSGYGLYLDDEYYLLDKRPEGAVKVLKDDVIVVYGEFSGMRSVTRALTLTQDEIPCIEVKYVDIVE